MIDLRSYGFAPGGYLNKCTATDCKTVHSALKDGHRWFDGAKGAYRCYQCAESARLYAISAPDKRPVRAPQIVRDKMVPREGVNEANKSLGKSLAVALLVQKLFLEVGEVAGDLKNADEYGDVLETLMSLALANGVTEGEVHEARRKKNDAKGRLTNNYWIPDHFMETSDVGTEKAA